MSTSPWDYKKFSTDQDERLKTLMEYIDKLTPTYTEEQIVKKIANLSIRTNASKELFAALNSYLIFKLYQEKQKHNRN